MAVTINEVWTEVIDPLRLTGFTRALLAAEDRPENALQLERWFPGRQVADIDYEISNGPTLDFTRSATFRTWNTESRIGRRGGIKTTRGSMPPLSQKIPLLEYEHLRQRNAPDQAFVATAERDAENNLTALRVRMEIARADALINSQVTINEDGIQGLNIVFERPAGNKAAVANPWSNASTGTPLTDELAVLTASSNTPGASAIGAVIMSTPDFANLALSQQYRDAYDSFRTRSRLNRDQVNEVRAAEGLPPVFTYDAMVEDQYGVQRRLLPVGTAIWLPNQPVGGTLWGLPASADLPGIYAPRDVGGPIAYVGVQYDPMTRWTVVDAIGTPVMNMGDSVFVRTGL